MTSQFLVLLVILSLLTCKFILAKDIPLDKEIQHYLKQAPFDMPELKIPSFSTQTFNIQEFGAVGDGLTMNTKAMARAIETCAKAGGGRIIIPAGIWLTGPLFLKSSVNLHLEKGAILLFSRNFDDYPLASSSYEGIEQIRCTSPINAVDVENIAITGEGIIDGAGDAWRPVKKFKMTSKQWTDLLASGGMVNKDKSIWWPTAAAMRGEEYLADLRNKNIPLNIENVMPAHDFLRPVLVRLTNCKNVLLDGPTFQNSPAWNIHPLLCENVIIRNITIRNPWYSQNGDGLDIESCKNVLVYNSQFDVGDDAICLKSGKDEAGRKRGRPAENIVIQHCTVYHGHGGLTIGSEMSGGVRNIHLANCTFIGTDVGLRFKSVRGRGGLVNNIFINKIQMMDIPNEAILFDLYYEGNPDEDNSPVVIPPVTDETPIFREIYFKNITCINAETAILLNGLPEMPLKQIEFDSILMTSKKGVNCLNSDKIKFTNAKLPIEKYPVFKINQCRDIIIQSSLPPDSTGTWLQVEGLKSQNIRVIGSPFNKFAPSIQLGEKVDPKVVVLERLE
ncbi:glycoside hydrolase family 28 protein [candidate division KSB1 bacterium]|nr:glycoside hydrolase family 28 protein [candidate division KSB1 bacterium]